MRKNPQTLRAGLISQKKRTTFIEMRTNIAKPHDRSKSASDKRIRNSTSIPQNLAGSSKRALESDPIISDDIEEVKKSLKIMTKKFNVAKKEKVKAFEELKKEKDRSKRFENDANFWREEYYKKQDSAGPSPCSAKKANKEQKLEECLDKIASLSFMHTKIVTDILKKDLSYDDFEIRNIKNIGEKSIPINDKRLKIKSVEDFVMRKNDEINVYNGNMKIVSKLAKQNGQSIRDDLNKLFLEETYPAKEATLLDEESSLED